MIADRYSILTKLGQGGTGITYSALDIKSNQQVAIKFLSLSASDNWKKTELFAREAKVLQQLHHPSIPQYLDFLQVESEDSFDFYIVQELAPGQSLDTLINNGWIPLETEVKQIAEQILEILIYLQELTPPVIHRDIKPQNIIYQPDTGKLFLVDFGAVKDTYHQTIMGSTVVGTYGYMAPEQYRGNAVLSTDLYSLGCTLLFLLTGDSPAELPQRKLKINFRSQVKIKRDFANWIEKLIEPDAPHRFNNSQDALAVLTGKNSLTNYNKLHPQKPAYTSIYFIEEKRGKFTTAPAAFVIPPVFLWKKHSLACILKILYCLGIFLKIALISMLYSWFGYIYGIINIVEIFTGWGLYQVQYIINFLVLLVLSWRVFSAPTDLVSTILFSILVLDALFVHGLRKRTIKDCLFAKRIKIFKRGRYKKIKESRVKRQRGEWIHNVVDVIKAPKALRIEYKGLGGWNWDGLEVSYDETDTAINFPKSFCAWRLNYQIGALLTSPEKKWLQEELVKRLKIN